MDNSPIQFPVYLCCFSFDYFFNSALFGESLVVLSLLRDFDELLSGNEVVEYHDVFAIILDEVLIRLARF